MMQIQLARRSYGATSGFVALALALSILFLLPGGSARARVLFDFEGPFLVDPGRGLKDHAIIRDNGLWHCFYIRGFAEILGTREETSFGHATSPDLRNWELQPTVLPVVPGTWESRNVWAPTIVANPGGGWTMLYTGTVGQIVQRMGRADSPDLVNWTRDPNNPVLEPDTEIYLWSPTEIPELSVFRDPFLFEKDGEWNVLNSVLLRDETAPLGYRGAIHRATSTDLTNWTAQPTFAVNNFPSAVSRELESVHLVEAAGGWNLFFTLFAVNGVQWVRSDLFDGPWELSNSVIIDMGNAAELAPIGPGEWIFTRYAANFHQPQHPEASEPFFVIRADTLRFDGQGVPQIFLTDPLAVDWPERTGTAFEAGIIFGDNSAERGEPATRPVGHGYLSSRENYDGPLGRADEPGDQLGETATGTITSRWITLNPTDVQMRLQIAGTNDPDCRVELVELTGGTPEAPVTTVRQSAIPEGSISIRPVTWSLAGLEGATVRLEVTDASTTGWILIDQVEVDDSQFPVAAPTPVVARDELRIVPNPFNPRTRIEFELGRASQVDVEIFDARGRRVLEADLGPLGAGEHGWTWEGRDDRGRPVASGVYQVYVHAEGGTRAARAVLVR